MKSLGFPLIRTPDIFSQNFFFVPDYQRGYAWSNDNVDDLLQDITHLMRVDDTEIIHYTGTLVLTKPVAIDGQIPRFGLVDGQQRMTTLVILMRCIAEAVEHSENHCFRRLQDTYVLRGEPGSEQPVMLLGKEVHPYFKKVIIGSESKEHVPVEYNSHQALLDAKQRIKKWLNSSASNNQTFPFDLIKVIENRIGFLVYSPENVSEIGIMFEVINNRGKELSELEKVKNYLIYCCSKIGAGTLRDEVNESWTRVLRNLRNAQKTTSTDESSFLRYCSVVHLQLNKTSSQYVYHWMKKTWDIETALSTPEHKAKLIKDIRKFSQFMEQASMWYAVLFGQNYAEISPGLAQVLEDLRSQNTYASVMPLILSVLVKKEGDSKERLLRLIEILNFRVYITQGITLRSDSGQGDLYTYASSYYHDEWDLSQNNKVGKIKIDTQDKMLEWRLCDFARSYCNDQVFRNSFYLTQAGNIDFFNWSGLRYFLMSYEAKIQPKKTISIDRILLGRGEGKTNDYYSVEHVWARENRNKEGQNNRPIDSFLKRRIGNFVLLELGINIRASNQDIEDKLKVYFDTDQPTDLQQVRYLGKDVKVALKTVKDQRLTKNRYYELYNEIRDRQETRYVDFALERWSLNGFLCSEFDEVEG